MKSEDNTGKSLRPVLIISEHTLEEYPSLLHHLLTGLADESISTALVCPQGSDVEPAASPLIEIIEHPAIELPLLGRYNRKILIDKLSKFKPTVLHCLCESRAYLTRQLTRQLELPYVLSVNSLQRKWGQFTLSSRRCAKIIVPAKTIADNLSQVYPRFAERIEQINMGAFTSEKVECFCHADRLASIVTAYPLDDVEGLENLLAAVRHLVIDGYEFMMVIIGRGRAERQLRGMLATMGLSQLVIIVPPLQPWQEGLSGGDIFVVPVAGIAFNPLLLEAMSAGSAIAGCKGQVDDLIIDGQTAAVFDPDDQLSIYDCLKELFDFRQRTRQLAAAAQQYVKENHSVSKMISSILQTYRQGRKR